MFTHVNCYVWSLGLLQYQISVANDTISGSTQGQIRVWAPRPGADHAPVTLEPYGCRHGPFGIPKSDPADALGQQDGVEKKGGKWENKKTLLTLQ